eukprot:13134156-Alexandrium_andersonii.AAC.1
MAKLVWAAQEAIVFGRVLNCTRGFALEPARSSNRVHGRCGRGRGDRSPGNSTGRRGEPTGSSHGEEAVETGGPGD